MAQDKEFVRRIVERLAPLEVRAKAMFGGYGLYCDEKFMGIIGDDRLYLKQSAADRDLLEGTTLEAPYETANDYHLVPEHLLADDEWIRTAVKATAEGLPAPKPKNKKPS
jgi:TfoX/Sxy family transcriptional regulator of competence genes